jgi:hypothetical protein
VSRPGRTPPPERVAHALDTFTQGRVQKDWERRRAYEDCLAAEQSLELAGLDYEARQVRKIRLYCLTKYD